MKKLIVFANPGDDSTSSKIAEIYAKESKKSKHDIENIDLYKSELQQGFLKFEEDEKEIKIQKEWQKKISWADEIVLIFPIWWGDAPAILKNWFENNFTPGFAYKYENHKAVGLLTDKTVKIFATCDAPSILYKTPIFRLKLLRGFYRLGFCGMKLNHFKIFGQMRKRKKMENYMEEIERFIIKNELK